MTNFLFWNIHKQPIIEVVANLVAFHEVDVLMLVECLLDPHDVQVALNLSDHLPIFFKLM